MERKAASVWIGAVRLSSFILLLLLPSSFAGELASLETAPYTPGVSHRQNFCDQYQALLDTSTTVTLRTALNGVRIHPVIQYGDGFPYFNYDPVTGIDEENPGLIAEMLDYIALQANFTWRDSFGVYTAEEKGSNRTWTEMLQWTTDTYDISIDKWAKSTDRLNRGISFCDPWFDGSLIMVDKIEPPPETNKITFGNWLRPFDGLVWIVTVATIVLSSVAYQLLEWMADERDDRTFFQWCSDNLYLSAVNFTQNYTYEPKTVAGRIFGFSFAFWTMLIGATYTANLASLLVEREPLPVKIADIAEGITRSYEMCTHEQSFSDLFVKREYGQAKRVPQPNPIDMYTALNEGQCDILIGTKQAWDSFELNEAYNPDCDLEWVGRQVLNVDAAFTTKFDPGLQCTELINQVFNTFLSEMKDNGRFDELWGAYNEDQKTPNFSCSGNAAETSSVERRRRLQERNDEFGYNRNLKGTSGNTAAVAAAVSENNDEEESLTLQQMAGTFLLHMVGTCLALIVGFISFCRKQLDRGVSSQSTRDEVASRDGSVESIQAQLTAMQASQKELTMRMAIMVSKLNDISKKLDLKDEQSLASIN